jgi:hypothetical protein
MTPSTLKHKPSAFFFFKIHSISLAKMQ